MEIAAELAGCDASDRIAMDAAGYGYAFEAADSRRVQAALVEAGYHGCSYGDMTPDNAMEHDCIRIFDAALLVITGTIED